MEKESRATLSATDKVWLCQKSRQLSALKGLLLFGFLSVVTMTSPCFAGAKFINPVCRATLSQVGLVTPGFSKRGLRKFNEFLAENPEAVTDKLVQYIYESITSGQRSLNFAEKHRPTVEGSTTLRRSLLGQAQINGDGTVIVDLEKINSNGIKHKLKKDDHTTLKIIYGLQLALAKRPDLQQIEFRISSIINMKYFAALERWGFVETSSHELSLFIRKDSN